MSAPKTERNDKIIAMAQGGMPPAAIARMLGLSVNRTNQVLSFARRRGVDIPYFRASRRTEKDKRPAEQPAEAPLTPEEIDRIAELANRNFGPTQIAPMVGKSYRAVFDVLEARGLLRGGPVA